MSPRLCLRASFRKNSESQNDELEQEPLIEEEKPIRPRKTLLKFLGLLCFLAACVVIIIIVVVRLTNKCPTETPAGPLWERLDGKFKHAAVVTNAPPCASIGKEILKKGGKAVDAMIGAMLCDGLTVPQSMGIGGGFFMVIYNREFKNITTINARETAPAAATQDMFHSNPTSSQVGGLSIGVPGEIKGYWTAYQRFGGGIPWKDIFLPIISMCEEGIPIDEKLGDILVQNEVNIKLNAEFRNLFVNRTTGAVLRSGAKYKNLKLAKTLKIIATQGGDAFYKGELAKKLADDIQKHGGIITEADLNNYEVDMSEPLVAPIFKNYTLYTLLPPSSGLVLAFILRLMDGLLPAASNLLYTQRVTEAFKFGYGTRSHLGDHRFVNITRAHNLILNDEYIKQVRSNISDTSTSNDPKFYGGDFRSNNDHGTANLGVLDKNGDAVVATSTINVRFGSWLLSESTGIILNNEMDDFSSPNLTNFFGLEPSPANFIEPGKRPLSSMCPSIVVDSKGDVKMLVGAAGGTKITTSVAITVLRTLLMNDSARQAMNNVTFHHQLTPMVWEYYPEDTPEDIVEQMQKIGHRVNMIAPTSFAAVTSIYRDKDTIFGSCDKKRPGQVDGF